jgi:hypothetical protein
MHFARQLTRLSAVLLVGGSVAVTNVVPASAHEERAAGPVKMVVGWVNEPSFTGYPNGVALFLNDANDQPIEDLGDTLEVEVSFGGETSGQLSLEPAFGEDFGTKGEYHADLIPTRPGAYTFHFTGTVRGQNVDETFTSSETGFDEVKDDAEVAFPAKDPSRGELAQRLDRIDPRLTAAQQAAATVESDVDDARTMATIAIVLAAIGVIAAIGMGAVAMRRRS